MKRISMFMSVAFVLFVSAAGAKVKPQINYHPGWLDPNPGTAFDVAAGWPMDGPDEWWPVEHPIEGTYTFGVNNPDGVSNDGSDFWNGAIAYSPSALWIYDEGVILQSNDQATSLLTLTPSAPWLFVQFAWGDWNDGIAEIAVKQAGWSDWLTVGSYDEFARGYNWLSIEGLPLGAYYVRITSRWNGRSVAPPQRHCPRPDRHANNLIPARMGTTAVVRKEGIQVTGGGLALIDGGTASIDLGIAFPGGQTNPVGTFMYVDSVLGASIQSTDIRGITVTGDQADILLVGVTNAGTYHAVVVSLSQGGPGVGTVLIKVSADWAGCESGWPYVKELTLEQGQIKIH